MNNATTKETLECANCGQVEELRHMTHSDTEPVYGWVCPACEEELGDRDPPECATCSHQCPGETAHRERQQGRGFFVGPPCAWASLGELSQASAGHIIRAMFEEGE